MKAKKIVMLMAISVVVFLLLSFVLQMTSLEWMRFFGVRKQNIEREIFRETRSYDEGMLQQLARYRLQYIAGDHSKKQAIKSTVRQMFAEYDPERIKNSDLRNFLKECYR